MKNFDLLSLFANNAEVPAKSKKRSRTCRIEELENREMLAVSLSEFAVIRSQYDNLGLSENISDYNIIEITESQITVQNLQNALAAAAQTTQDDLIVVRTDNNNNTLTLNANPLTIDIDSSIYGSVAIVSLSATSTLLTVDTQNMSRAFRINNGNVALGGMDIVGQTWSFDIGSDYDGLIAVRGQSTLTTSRLWTTATVPPPQASFDPAAIPVSLGNDALTLDHSESGVWNVDDSMIVAAPYGAANRDGSEYMIGGVWVTLVLMESNGEVDPDETDWSQEQITQTITGVREGLDWWEDMFDRFNPHSQIKLTFSLDSTWADTPFETSYEAIMRPSTEESFWVGEFLTSQGYTGDYENQSHLPNMREFNHEQRVANDTDWAFSIFVINTQDSEGQPVPHDFGAAYAGLGGPISVIPYRANMGAVTAHETGHIFYALDEYTYTNSVPGPPYHHSSYYAASGYYNVQNTNATWERPSDAPARNANALMESSTQGYNNWNISDETALMIGWRDSNGNGILDVLDVPLTLENVTYDFDQLTGTATFSATSSVATLPNQNPYGMSNDITLNTVDRLQYRIDDGSWIMLPTVYGGTTNVAVNATVTVPTGAAVITFRTICERTGVTSEELSYDSATTEVPGNFRYTNRTADTVELAWDSVTDATGYEIRYREVGSTDWSEPRQISSENTSYTIRDLETSTSYEFQILTTEGTNSSPWSSPLSVNTLPAVPSNFDIDNNMLSNDSVVLVWNFQPRLTGYTLEYKLSSESTWTNWTPAPGPNDTSVTIDGLSGNTQYDFRIRAENANDNSDWQERLFIETGKIPLSSPTLIEVESTGSRTVRVSWNPIADASGYAVEYSPNDDFENATQITVDNTSTTLPVRANTTYYVRVMALGTGDFSNSNWSQSESAHTPAIQLDPPMLIDVRATGSYSINVSWNAVVNASGYTIQYATKDDFNDAWTQTVDGGTTATLSDLSVNTLYYVRIMANGTGEYSGSDYSDAESALTEKITLTAPVLGDVIAIDAETIEVSWGAVANADGYVVEFSTSNLFTDAESIEVLTGTSLLLTDLDVFTTYFVRVMAIGTGDYTDSEFSVARSATTYKVELSVPTLQSVTATSGNTISVTWSRVENASGYLVQYSTDSSFSGTVGEQQFNSGSATSANIGGLMPNETYFVRVMAIGTGAYSNSAWQTSPAVMTLHADPVKPTVKADKKASTVSTVTLTWTPDARNAIYDIVDRTTGVKIDASQIEYIYSGGNISGAVISGLAHGKTYRFSVVAKNANDKDTVTTKSGKETSTAVSVSAKTQKYAAPKSIKADTAKTGLTSITVNWGTSTAQLPPGVTESYVVELWDANRKVLIMSSLDTSNVIIDGTSATFTGLNASTKYTVVVKAVTSEGIESLAGRARVSTAKYAAVQGFRAVAGEDYVNLSWYPSPFPETDGYEIFRLVGRTEIAVATLPTSETSATIADLEPSTRYTFVIRAVMRNTLTGEAISHSLNAKASAKTQKLVIV